MGDDSRCPTVTSVVAHDGALTVTFTPPSDTGGTPITSYTVTVAGQAAQQVGTSSPITLTGLTPGTPATVSVIATNAVGPGPPGTAGDPTTPNANVSLLATAPPAGDVGVAYADTLAATGGTGPFTYAITTPGLPAGLTLSAGGVISGTPTTAGGPTSFTVTVTDADGLTATQPFTITIAPAPTLAVLHPPTVKSGIAYTDTLAATGGTGPFTYAVTTPGPSPPDSPSAPAA